MLICLHIVYDYSPTTEYFARLKYLLSYPLQENLANPCNRQKPLPSWSLQSITKTDSNKINVLEWLAVIHATENKKAGVGVRECCEEVRESHVARMTWEQRSKR